MSANGIKAKKRKFRATTDSNHSHPVAPNLLERDFTAQEPNQRWLADLTYIPTGEGWLYLAAVLDLHSRLIVGWSLSSRMSREAMSDIFWFIEVFYSRSRRHSALGYLTPTEYEIVRLAA